MRPDAGASRPATHFNNVVFPVPLSPITAIVAPAGVGVSQAALNFDIPVMTAVAVACLPVFVNGYRIARWEGGLFLAYYIAYAGYLALRGRALARDEAIPFGPYLAAALWIVWLYGPSI